MVLIALQFASLTYMIWSYTDLHYSLQHRYIVALAQHCLLNFAARSTLRRFFTYLPPLLHHYGVRLYLDPIDTQYLHPAGWS